LSGLAFTGWPDNQHAIYSYVFSDGDGGSNTATLTIGPGITVRSSQGGFLGNYHGNDSLVNQGTIVAEGTGKSMTLRGLAWVNSGLLKAANGGTLLLIGEFTQAGLGTFDSNGGTININGVLNNTASTLALDATTGSLMLTGTIKGGTIKGSDGAQLIIRNDTLEGVTLSAEATVSNGYWVAIRNGLTLNGTLTLASTSSWTNLYFYGTQSLLGTGQIVFGDTGPYGRLYVNGQGYGATLTAGSGVRLHGAGGIGANYVNDGFINQGTISADMSGQTLSVSFTSWTNSGTLGAKDRATLALDGLDNSGNAVALDASGGLLRFDNRGVKGGAISSVGGAKLTLLNGLLDGVTLNTDMALRNGGTLTIRNGLALNGKLAMGSTNSSTSLTFIGTQSFLGSGQVEFGDQSPYNRLIIDGQGYGATLTAGPGITLHGRGSIFGNNPSDVLVNQETISADVAGQILSVAMPHWTNSGSLQAREGATLVVDGLDNTGKSLALDMGGGLLRLDNRGIKGGVISATGGSKVTVLNGVLDGVTLNADMLIANGASLRIVNGLTLNATLTLDSRGTYTYLYFNGSQTLSGSGQVLLGGTTPYNRVHVNGQDYGATLTIGPGIAIRGSGLLSASYVNDTIVNQGAIRLDSMAFHNLMNLGSIEVTAPGTADVNGTLTVDVLGALASQPSATFAIGKDLVGTTRNADQYAPLGRLVFDGAGDAIVPQLLEAFSKDVGPDPAGFDDNFAYGTLVLGGSTRLQLVDRSDNAPGTESEAVYVNSLVVPSGTTLDLNGLHLYARLMQVSGLVLGGTVQQVPDGGPIGFSSPTPGSIDPAGQLDEWSFFARGGRSVTVAVNPGSSGPSAPISPYLAYAQVQILDAQSNVLASGTGTSSGQIIVLTDASLPTDGTYRIQVQAPGAHIASTGNYVVTLWDVTPRVSTLLLNQQVGGRIETPYSVDRWSFSATAGQQIRFDLINTSGTGIAFDLTGPEGWTGFSDINTDSDLITLPSAGSYTLTAHGTGGQYGSAYSFRLQETAQTDLAIGSVYNGALAGSGQAQIFRLRVAANMPMRVTLDDIASADHNELYAKFGSPPTRADYDFRFPSPSSPDQQILVPMATSGTWYVLTYADYAPAPSMFTLSATAAGLMLDGITPDHAGNAQDTTLTLTGAGFERPTVVQLVSSQGATYGAASVEIDSFTQITATFAAGTVPSGTYSIVLRQPDGDSAELPAAFQITGGGQARLETNLILPEAFGYHELATIYIEYRNAGDLAMPAPLLTLTATQLGRQGALLTLDYSRLTSGFWTSAIPQGFDTSVQFLASGEIPGTLQPGESGRLPVYYAGWLQPWDFTYSPITFDLRVLQTSNTTAVDWNALKDTMLPPGMGADAWSALWAAFTSQVGSTWGDYLRMLDDNAAYLGRLGQRVVDVGDLLSFEMQQANGLAPMRTLSNATDAAVESPGLPLGFSRVYGEAMAQRYETGPLGRGWSHNWQFSISEGADGTVTILGPGSFRRVFQPDSRGGRYFAQPGDHGTLSKESSGTFTLREANGMLQAFRANGKLDYQEDTNGNRITCGYTGGQLTSLAHSSGSSLQIPYGGTGRINRIVDPLGRETRFTYDASGEHLALVQYADGRSIGYSYDSGHGVTTEHALTRIAQPDGTHVYFDYDGQGRLIGTHRDGEAEPLTFAYDSVGKVTVTNGAGDTGKFYYDHRGLLVKYEDGLGNSGMFAFDGAGNMARISDPAGRVCSYVYDGAGNLTVSTDPVGATTRFAYTGPFNRMASMVDANGNVTRYSVDSRGNVTSMTYADGSIERWEYAATGLPSAWTDQRGRTIRYTYDAAGRLTRKVYADGSRADFAYDAKGRLASTADTTGTTTMTGSNGSRTRVIGTWSSRTT